MTPAAWTFTATGLALGVVAITALAVAVAALIGRQDKHAAELAALRAHLGLTTPTPQPTLLSRATTWIRGLTVPAIDTRGRHQPQPEPELPSADETPTAPFERPQPTPGPRTVPEAEAIGRIPDAHLAQAVNRIEDVEFARALAHIENEMHDWQASHDDRSRR